MHVRNHCNFFYFVDHPSYSPDLTSSDDYIFSSQGKRNTVGKQHKTEDMVISVVEDFFKDQDVSFYTAGTQALQSR